MQTEQNVLLTAVESYPEFLASKCVLFAGQEFQKDETVFNLLNTMYVSTSVCSYCDKMRKIDLSHVLTDSNVEPQLTWTDQ